MNTHNPPTLILGDNDNRMYLDATGKPLKEGDTVVYATSQSSSVSMNFAVITEIVDIPRPVYMGYQKESRRRIESWDRAFKLKVKRVDQHPEFPDVLVVPQKFVYVPGNNDASHFVDQTLDDLKTTTIIKVERVIKIEGMELDGR